MHPQFLLCADVHLRSAQYNRESRGEDFATAFDRVIDVAIARKVNAILVPGDLLDQRRPSPEVVKFLRHVHDRIQSAGIPMYVTSGNHDLTSPHWASLVGVEGDAPSGIVIIDNRLVTVPGTNVTIFGQPFVPKDKFLEIRGQLPSADMLLFHCMTQEMTPFKSDAAFSCQNDLPWDKYRLIGIGDIHIPDEWIAPNGTLVLQPGSTELCSSGEPFEKSVVLFSYDTTKRQAYQVERVPIQTRKVLKFLITTEQEVEDALSEAEKIREDTPIIFIKFDPRLQAVPQRFAARFDPTRFIIRPEPLFTNIKQGVGLGMDMRENLSLADFLGKFIPPGTKQYELARALLDSNTPIVENVDRFVTERQQETHALAPAA